MPSNFDEKNAIVFWGQYPGNFETKFFHLKFEGISYNSVLLANGGLHPSEFRTQTTNVQKTFPNLVAEFAPFYPFCN